MAKMFMVVVATLALVSPSVCQENINLPFTVPARVINATGQVCPPNHIRVSERNKIAQDVRDLLRTVTAPSCQEFQTQSSPAVSCSTLPTSCPSGYYWVRSSNGSAVQVYCDMVGVCGCNTTPAEVTIATTVTEWWIICSHMSTWDCVRLVLSIIIV